ncbi:MAG TPA: hypothetical protein VE057_00465 [Archangium sp.]|nr:hypothetical protein [Archangium sp.]
MCSEHVDFESATGIIVGDNDALLALLSPQTWLEGLPVGSCLQKGDLEFSSNVLRIDDRAKGDCGGAESLVRTNIKNSGRLRKAENESSGLPCSRASGPGATRARQRQPSLGPVERINGTVDATRARQPKLGPVEGTRSTAGPSGGRGPEDGSRGSGAVEGSIVGTLRPSRSSRVAVLTPAVGWGFPSAGPACYLGFIHPGKQKV